MASQALLLLSLLVAGVCAQQTALFLPLDERFTTRDAFLNLAKQTPFRILTPPTALLPNLKQPPSLPALHNWVDSNVAQANALIVSAEMYLYGGLIGSRTSNDTTDEIDKRLQKLAAFKTAYPQLDIYLSAVVMRIPAYNGDFEEPWYWAQYGQYLFEYSFYLDKYNTLHNPDDLNKAKSFQALIPPSVLSTFVWRRQRNFNITRNLLETLSKSGSFKYVYITQDDNAEFGFNIAEANALRAMVEQLKLQAKVKIYPGADEVQLTMLARRAVDLAGRSPVLQLVFRDPNTIEHIPNYEGQPMIVTLREQIVAAGGVVSNASVEAGQIAADADIVMLVNNFSEKKQVEAPNQPSGGSIAQYSMFTPYLLTSRVIGFADNRYSNGADNLLLDYMAYQHTSGASKLPIGQFAYAGWNTNGNTLGTVISNAIVLHLFRKPAANAHFNTLRILEDKYYQAIWRQSLTNFANQVGGGGQGKAHGESSSNLAPDLTFYKRMAFKSLDSYYSQICATYGVSLQLQDAYFPWNRTFEIGLIAT